MVVVVVVVVNCVRRVLLPLGGLGKRAEISTDVKHAKNKNTHSIEGKR